MIMCRTPGLAPEHEDQLKLPSGDCEAIEEIWTDSEDEEWGADSLPNINGSLDHEGEGNDSVTARVLEQQKEAMKQ